MEARREDSITASVVAPKALNVYKIIFRVVPIGMSKVCMSPHRSCPFTVSVSTKRVGNFTPEAV